MNDETKCIGNIKITVEDASSGEVIRVIEKKNTVLNVGKTNICNAITNNIGTTYNYYINSMLLSDGGVDGSGNPLVVSPERTGLFHSAIVTLPVFAVASNNTATFTATLGKTVGNGNAFSELALMMASGDIYSLSTINSLSKNSSIQVTIVWTLTFL